MYVINMKRNYNITVKDLPIIIDPNLQTKKL